MFSLLLRSTALWHSTSVMPLRGLSEHGILLSNPNVHNHQHLHPSLRQALQAQRLVQYCRLGSMKTQFGLCPIPRQFSLHDCIWTLGSSIPLGSSFQLHLVSGVMRVSGLQTLLIIYAPRGCDWPCMLLFNLAYQAYALFCCFMSGPVWSLTEELLARRKGFCLHI